MRMDDFAGRQQAIELQDGKNTLSVWITIDRVEPAGYRYGLNGVEDQWEGHVDVKVEYWINNEIVGGGTVRMEEGQSKELGFTTGEIDD